MMPWKTQETVSRMEAVFFGSMPYSFEISLAMGPARTMVTVLFAVAMSRMPVSAAMPNMPPFLPFAVLWIMLRMASKPPFAFMSAPMDATSSVTMMVSNMPERPSPMAVRAVVNVRDFVNRPTARNRTVPPPRTKNTLTPSRAAMRTMK